jgi:lipoprotein-anchoring transpeptidase ErfK/SrfK
MPRFFERLRHGGRLVWALIAAVTAAGVFTVFLAGDVVRERFRRDVMRMAFNHNLDLLDDVRRSVDTDPDSVAAESNATSADAPEDKPYIVVSINDNRLWYRDGNRTLFTTRVATGSGRELIKEGGLHWKFETPRGRLVVESKETDPVWVPPDWHYIEMATKRHMGVVKLARGQTIPVTGKGVVPGTKITVVGNDVVTLFPDGHYEPFEAKEGHEIVANGNIIIPPFGTNQRKYIGTLGVNRLYLGDGYGLHGTDEPASIGRAASHGCVRLRNEDIETLYRIVPVGTVVYIY